MRGIVACVLVASLLCLPACMGRPVRVSIPAVRAASAWRAVGPAVGTERVNIYIAVKRVNAHFLDEKLAQVSDPKSAHYGEYMTFETLAERVHGSPASVAAITTLLAAHGVTDFDTTMDAGFIVARASAASAASLFGAEFTVFEHVSEPDVRIVKTLATSLPATLREHADFVIGHNTFPAQEKSQGPRVAAQQAADLLGVTPSTIYNSYNIGNYIATSSQNSQAVASFLKQYFKPKDLATFQSTYKIPSNPISKVVGPNIENDEGVEAALDVQYLTAVGRGISTWFVSTSQTANKGQEDFLTWIIGQSNTTNSPYVHSVSYGDVEDSIDPSYRDRVNDEFKKFGVTGRTIMIAAGDSGVSCHDGNKFWPDWPTSSPYITSVGGTTPIAGEENVWSDGGGGFSNAYTAPSYQSAAIQAYLSSSAAPPTKWFNVSGRAYPDVAAFATNVAIVVDGSTLPVDGTSCATPIFSGVVSLLNDVLLSAGKPTLGFLNPLLYQLGAQHPEAFHDVTKGSNPAGQCPGFTATKGWDPASGWGSPDFGVLKTLVVQAFENKPKKL